MTFPTWRRPSRCGHCECVEVKIEDTRVLVRGPTQPEVPALTFTLREWRAFIAGAKDGEFDV